MILVMALMGGTGGSINIITVSLPTLIMVMGTAYGVHFLSRFIEETAAGHDQRTATSHTLRHMTLAIFMTSVTTGVGFLSLLVMRVRLVRMFGIYAAAGMVIAFGVAIVFLASAVLLQKPWRGKAIEAFGGDVFRRYLLWNWRYVRDRHRAILLFSLLLMLVSIVGITQLKVDAGLMLEIHPKSAEYKANAFFEEHLTGVLNLNLMIEGSPDAFLQPANLRKLAKVTAFARDQRFADGHPVIDHALSFADMIALMNQAMYDGDPTRRRIPSFPEAEGGDDRARQAVAQYMLLYGDPDDFENLVTGDYRVANIAMRMKDYGAQAFRTPRSELIAFAREVFGDEFHVQVAGESVMAGHIITRLVGDMTKSLVLAALIIVVVFFVLFRSWRLGLLAMVPNILPLMVTMAAMGYAGVILRTSIVMVFSIALGIAVDDTIHFIARLRAETAAGKDLDDAVRDTFLGSGRAIVFTSLILCAGFTLLFTSDFLPTSSFGWLSAITMVTALIGDLFLLPALVYFFRPNIH